MVLLFFFFKQKTAYEMRISDWSSDVCSSDLLYAFGSYGIRDANAAGFYRRSNDSRNRDYGASLTDFVPYYPNGFLPQITSEIEDVSGAVGLKGEIGGGWNADLSVVYGSNQLDYGVVNSFNKIGRAHV